MDSQLFRQVMSHFPSGVTVVTAKGASGDLHGMTCSAFCSISAAHPSVMVCLTRNTRTQSLVEATKTFCVNVLAAHQAHLADRFAGRHADRNSNRFDQIGWAPGVLGLPILEGVQAHLECALARAVDFGDHMLCIGEVKGAAFDPSVRPLLYHFGAYADVTAKN